MPISPRWPGTLVAMALALTLAAPPSDAAAARRPTPTPSHAPKPVAEHREGFPWLALAPVGLSAGYVYGGHWGRAALVPVVVYGAVAVGAVAGLVSSFDQASWAKPLESIAGFIILPVLGAGAAFGASTVVVLLDQAFLPHAGGPWVAPALTVGVVSLLVVAQVWPDHDQDARLGLTAIAPVLRASALGPDHHPGLTLEERERLVHGDAGAAQLLR